MKIGLFLSGRIEPRPLPPAGATDEQAPPVPADGFTASRGLEAPASLEFQASLGRATRNAPRVTVLRGETREFVKETGTLRAVVQGAREGRPGCASLLQEQYGYDLATLPAEGTLFIDPYFVAPEARAGLIRATTFPDHSAPAAPRDADPLLFGDRPGLSIREARPRTRRSPSRAPSSTGHTWRRTAS